MTLSRMFRTIANLKRDGRLENTTPLLAGAYSVTALVYLIGVYFTLLWGLKFEQTQASSWLFSSLIGFGESAAVSQPLTIILRTVLGLFVWRHLKRCMGFRKTQEQTLGRSGSSFEDGFGESSGSTMARMNSKLDLMPTRQDRTITSVEMGRIGGGPSQFTGGAAAAADTDGN